MTRGIAMLTGLLLAGGAASGAALADEVRRAEIVGQVVDRDGRPLGGARVFLSAVEAGRPEATTDAEGRFSLPTPAGRAAFIFVDASGHRFHGQPLATTIDRLELTVTSSDMPPPRRLTTLAHSLPRDDRLGLAEQTLRPAVDAGLESRDFNRISDALLVLAEVAPWLSLELLGDNPLEGGLLYHETLQGRIAAQLYRERPDEALMVIESLQLPVSRAMSLAHLQFWIVPEDRIAERRELAARLVQHASAIEEVAFRLMAYAYALRCLRKAGMTDELSAVLQTAVELGEKVPHAGFDGYARSQLAAEVAFHDLELALHWLAANDEWLEYARHHGNAARLLAAERPRDAERMLNRLTQGRGKEGVIHRDHYAVQVCYRMASADPDRAEAIATSIDHRLQRGQAYGLMARTLAQRRPELADRLLQQAVKAMVSDESLDVERLDLSLVPGRIEWELGVDACVRIASLLPAVEAIDADGVEELMWRAVSLLPPAEPGPAGFHGSRRDLAPVFTAALIARYDRAVARLLLRPYLDPVPTLFASRVIMAAALVDPQLATFLLESLSDAESQHRARAAFALTLARDGELLWEPVHAAAGLWWPREEEAGPGPFP